MKAVLTLMMILLPAVCCRASEPATDDWQQFFIQLMEDRGGEDDYTEEELSEALENLQELSEHPFNLNQATDEQLRQLPFLSDDERDALLHYLFRYAPMRSFGELRLVKDLEWTTIELLPHFVFIDPHELLPDSLRMLRLPDSLVYNDSKDARMKKATVSQQRHEFLASAVIPFYEREGDKDGYLGYPYRHWLRYDYHDSRHLRFGLVAAQEAGEPFFAGKNRYGYDHYGAYLVWTGHGLVKTVVAGDFKATLGMGLTLNSGIHLGKSSIAQSITRNQQTLRPHTSRSENCHLTGAGITLQPAGAWTVTFFASHQCLDATLWADGSVRTLLTSNPHRTPNAMERRNNTRQTTEGGQVKWQSKRAHFAFNAVGIQMSRPLRAATDSQSYRRFYPEGKHFANVSVDYGLRKGGIRLWGETALDHHAALATIHQLQLRLNQHLHFTTIHRYYSRRYTTLLGHSFSQNSKPQNEHGLYVSALWRPEGDLMAEWYADYAHFSWKRYRVSLPSDALDTQLSLGWQHGKWHWQARYRMRLQQQDDSTHQWVRNHYTHRLRLSADRSLGTAWQLKVHADGTFYHTAGTAQTGGIVGSTLTYHRSAFRLLVMGACFCTSGWDARIYQYEPSTQGNASFPVYSGRGLRTLLQCQTSIGALSVSGRLALTHYTDRDTIGTGLQQVCDNTMCDFQLSLRYRF